MVVFKELDLGGRDERGFLRLEGEVDAVSDLVGARRRSPSLISVLPRKREIFWAVSGSCSAKMRPGGAVF